jgi:ParB family chromosome partitioning protein
MGDNAVSTPTRSAPADAPAAQTASSTQSLPLPSTGDSVSNDVPGVPEPAPSHLDALWDDGNRVADLVFEKMLPAQREVLLERLLAAHGND